MINVNKKIYKVYCICNNALRKLWQCFSNTNWLPFSHWLESISEDPDASDRISSYSIRLVRFVLASTQNNTTIEETAFRTLKIAFLLQGILKFYQALQEWQLHLILRIPELSGISCHHGIITRKSGKRVLASTNKKQTQEKKQTCNDYPKKSS